MNYFKFFCFKKEKEPWQISAARYCVDQAEKGFTEDDLRIYIKSLYEVEDYNISSFFNEEIIEPTGRKFSRNYINKDGENFWVPPLDLVSKVTDYDELKEARKNARQAFWLSIIAIIISAITILKN